ncbi:MAG: hypothetical protein ACREDR_31975, partial [Blastocatellia bacterium]
MTVQNESISALLDKIHADPSLARQKLADCLERLQSSWGSSGTSFFPLLEEKILNLTLAKTRDLKEINDDRFLALLADSAGEAARDYLWTVGQVRAVCRELDQHDAFARTLFLEYRGRLEKFFALKFRTHPNAPVSDLVQETLLRFVSRATKAPQYA